MVPPSALWSPFAPSMVQEAVGHVESVVGVAAKLPKATPAGCVAMLEELLCWRHDKERITATAALAHAYVGKLATGREPSWGAPPQLPIDDASCLRASAYRKFLYQHTFMADPPPAAAA